MRRNDRLTSMLLVCRMLWAGLVLAWCGMAVPAAARTLGFEHFIHSMLESKDGLPAQANSIVQTPDGYMWFGTPDGLFRYNGQTFERVPVNRKGAFTEAAVIEAIITRRGEMWLAAGQNAGVIILRDGVLHQTDMTAPPPQITHLVERADGTIWAASSGASKRLYRYVDRRWQQMDIGLDMPSGAVADLEADRHGTIWASLAGPDGGTLAYLKAGGARFEVAPDRIGLGRLTLDRNGGLWISDNFGTRMLRDAGGLPPVRPIAYPPVPNIGFPKIKFDRKGNIWGSSLSGGMFLIPDAGNVANAGRPPETFGNNRLGTVATLDVFPDREGNIWISSSESLHRFHPANAVRVSAIASHPSSPQRLAAALDGSIYLFSLGRLYRIQPNDEPRLIASDLGDNAVLCAARSGGVWYLDDSRTLLFDSAGRRALPGPAGGRDMPILCEEDGFGRLWSISKSMIGWFRDGLWHRGFPGLGQVDIWDVATDPGGALILSVGANKLLRVDEQKVAPVETGWTGSISSMRTTRSGLLVSHATGLWRGSANGRRAASRTGRALAKARDFDVDEDYFWVFGLAGVKRIPLTEFSRSAGGRMDAPAATMVFDWSEGLPVGKQDVGFRGRQIAMGRDGRLWVLTRAGPYVIDNQNVIRNMIPPPLVIRALWAGGRRLSDVQDGQKLRGGTRSVRIAYSALSYSMPERVRFKYRLIGASSEWTDAGNRHEVTFDNLGPGNYRFEVAGANEDGVWSDRPAVLNFVIAPTFLQSTEVKLGVALLLLIAIILAYRWRTYILTRRVRTAMSARSAERDRIARELHDTLLQSVQGLILRFQLLVDHLPAQHPARTELFTTLDQADEILAESRKRVLDLRARTPRSDLKSIITAVAERQLPASRFQTDVRTSGTVRPVELAVFNILIDVANESLFNILRHAEASRVSVEIRYHPAHLEMEIADNGIGLDTAAISTAAARGHFGIVGMHERIANIGGKLRLESQPGEGTTVVVQIPSSIAYRVKNAQSAEKAGGKNRGGFWLWSARRARQPAGR